MIQKSNVTLNIGLNVNYIEPLIQEGRTLYHLNEEFPSVLETSIKEGNSNWGKERIVVAHLETVSNLETIDFRLEELCNLLSQDAIAYKFQGVGRLAFNSKYKGERYPFNEEYFQE